MYVYPQKIRFQYHIHVPCHALLLPVSHHYTSLHMHMYSASFIPIPHLSPPHVQGPTSCLSEYQQLRYAISAEVRVVETTPISCYSLLWWWLKIRGDKCPTCISNKQQTPTTTTTTTKIQSWHKRTYVKPFVYTTHIMYIAIAVGNGDSLLLASLHCSGKVGPKLGF